ncbi:MAG TPA: hypothetical protein VFE03_02135 [Caulobacteraceae bacterium]|nr:hypothetical protein [Caulobacteraceae bacterium]
MCHVGGFGPQLTPFGRNFKLNGYTLRGGALNVPVSAMAVASYIRTAQDQPPEPGFKANDNVALDEFAVFLAGGLGQHFGGFAEVTYDGVGKTWAWDNLDLRAVAKTEVKGAPVVLGLSLNNSPGVQDVWNTLPAWGFPYTDSALAPSPAAAPLLSGALAQNTLGLTGYAWINSAIYFEAGAYGSPGASTLRSLGADPFSPGDIDGMAPYGRVALQKTFGAHTVEVGVFGMRAEIFPGRDRSAGVSDAYRDIGLDASYQATLASGDVVSLNARYIDERQSLRASQVLGLAANRRNSLRDFRADVSYYWRDKIGFSVQAFDTTGSADTLLYADNRTLKPDSSGVTLQLDATPFGDRGQPQRRVNVRVGVQYTAYTRFNGAKTDFDGAGTKASDENTLRIFTWFAF